MESSCHFSESVRLRRTQSPIGYPGTTHRNVTGPQVVSQCSLQEQPSVYAILISQVLPGPRTGYTEPSSLSRPLLKGSYCMGKSELGINFANWSRSLAGFKHANCLTGRLFSSAVIRIPCIGAGSAQTCSKARLAKSSSCLKQTNMC
jgi:hypothetical protein